MLKYSSCGNLNKFLYTHNGLLKREIKEIIAFTITSKRIRYLEICLTKEVKDLHTEEDKLKKTQLNRKIFQIHGLEKMIVKMSILPKIIYRFNANAIKIPMAFIIEIEETILKFIWSYKRPQTAVLRKNSKAEDITLSYFRLYHMA